MSSSHGHTTLKPVLPVRNGLIPQFQILNQPSYVKPKHVRVNTVCGSAEQQERLFGENLHC